MGFCFFLVFCWNDSRFLIKRLLEFYRVGACAYYRLYIILQVLRRYKKRKGVSCLRRKSGIIEHETNLCEKTH